MLRAAVQETCSARSLPGLVTDRKGRWPEWNHANAGLVLELHPDWSQALAFDELTGLVMLERPIPGSRSTGKFEPRPLADADITATTRWFCREFHPTASRAIVADVVDQVARQTVRSPIREYLGRLDWDGRARIDRWLSSHLGAEDTAFTREIGRRWLVSAVARALSPGCQADHVLVLEGPQGAGKSSALRTLASEVWFHDGLPDLHSKDAAASLRGRWIVELAELTAMRRSDVEATKAFLSRQVERFRPPYGRHEVVEPRRCVFAATTNSATYLKDATGARRFWPVKIGRIDLALLAVDRDQLWAEAAVALAAGDPWWLGPDMEAAAVEQTASRSEEDTWSAAFADHLAAARETTTRACLAAVGIPPSAQTPALARRAADVLRTMGYEDAGRITSGPDRRLRRWVLR